VPPGRVRAPRQGGLRREPGGEKRDDAGPRRDFTGDREAALAAATLEETESKNIKESTKKEKKQKWNKEEVGVAAIKGAVVEEAHRSEALASMS
jgi:hypothetical protein